MQRPSRTLGLHHLALWAVKFDECLYFYKDIIGMEIIWQPDPDNVYLTSIKDNLALHRAAPDFILSEKQGLDHLGFILDSLETVDEWFTFMKSKGVECKNAPRTHRDGARSFYCFDPDGRTVQMIYYSPISD